jgi:glyoxylase-like metal-dependent hydrolase (beta-lactamase superfamily II)
MGREGSGRRGRWKMGRDRILRTLLLLTMGAAASAPGGQAQKSAAAAEARLEGMALLTAGLEAMGGRERLAALGSVRLEAEVTQYQVGQTPRPDELAVRLGTSTYALTRNLRTQEWYLDASASPEAPEPRLRVVSARGDSFQHDLRNNTILEVPEGLGLEALAERLPFAPAALLEAWSRSETVRALPPGSSGAAALTYADSAGRQIALTFDGRGLVRSIGIVERHGQLGDVVKRSTFTDYRAVADLLLPFTVVNTLDSLVTCESVLHDVTLDPPLEGALFSRPEGVPSSATQNRPTVADGAQKVEEIVPGVFQILNVTPLYNVMLVQQDDDVYVIDAPGGETAYELVRDSALRVLGGKEITGLVLTHHHFDHSSNLWRYLASGTKVFAPSSNEPFIRSVADAPRLGLREPRFPEPDIEAVDSRLTVGTGVNRFELIDAGPNPHADAILIVYFPEHKLFWVPDIYGYYPGFTPPPLLLSFAERFEELDLDVEIIATAHTELSSVTEFRDMVRRVRAGLAQPGGSDR